MLYLGTLSFSTCRPALSSIDITTVTERKQQQQHHPQSGGKGMGNMKTLSVTTEEGFAEYGQRGERLDWATSTCEISEP